MMKLRLILALALVIAVTVDASAFGKKKAPAKAAAHPPVAEMVNAAIAALKERTGSSLPAIKKYVAANYKVDMVKMAPFIGRYIRKAVADGGLVQKKGTGASGSFRLGMKPKAPKKAKKPKAPKKAKKPAKPIKKAAKPATKKPAAKKPAAKKAAK